ncbi:site-specific integrase [Terribacillus saccharophilus]|uniref:site-specific integrase n=1 Tax=Terribacillus saccharophilus TaxID=361277 RepID=UPI002DD3D472|nr:site-specific integrase [Terribacillus saccharophilus]MEC0288841.1 site-specific integrase [Terribacillus saccharophilus]
MASFRKRGSKWEFRIVYKDKRTGKRREKTGGGFSTKTEARKAATQMQSDLDYHGFIENGNEIISRYFEDWLEVYKRPYVKPITYSLQERNVRLNILPRWGNYQLKELNRTEYQKWINELPGKYSEGTIRRIHSIMNSAINDAVHEFQVLKSNPIQRIKIPKQVDREEKLQYFTRQQMSVFLDGLKSPQKNAKYQHSKQYLYLFTLMSRTGLRIGEALALTWEDFDEQKKTITVDKTLVYPTNSAPYLSTPKSKKSVRKVKLDDFTVKALKMHRINQKETVLKYERYRPSKDGVIFHQHEGRWLRTNIVRDFFKVHCKRMDLPVLSPHALRHSHAVHLLEAGANIKYVSERLGHASVKVTADTYLHVTEKIEDDALNQYSSYIEG